MGDKFKNGDKVKFVDDGGYGRVKKGDTGVVRRCEGDGIPLVKLDTGLEAYFHDFRLQLVDDEAPLKVGDVVETKTRCGYTHSKPPGSIGIVFSIKGEWLMVEFPGWTGGHDGVNPNPSKPGIGSRWCVFSGSLKRHDLGHHVGVYSWKPETFIVVSDEGPSSRPFKHPSRKAAETEASRLALKIPGMNFTVYHAVSAAKASKPIAELQKLAA